MSQDTITQLKEKFALIVEAYENAECGYGNLSDLWQIVGRNAHEGLGMVVGYLPQEDWKAMWKAAVEKNADYIRRYSEEHAQRIAWQQECKNLKDTQISQNNLVEALQKIEKWELPPSGEFWDNEKRRPMSFGAAFGSNGERDYFRQIARKALNTVEPKEKDLVADNEHHFDLVKQWHEAFGVPVLYKPEITNRAYLRAKIIMEEAIEVCDSITEKGFTISDVAKELCDCLYVIYGTALEFGLTNVFNKCFLEVHRSNMSKLDENGKPILRGDGKVLKSKLYSPANIDSILLNSEQEVKECDTTMLNQGTEAKEQKKKEQGEAVDWSAVEKELPEGENYLRDQLFKNNSK